MIELRNVQHRLVDIDTTRAHAFNQVSMRRLRNGDVLAVLNEERSPFHHDDGFSLSVPKDHPKTDWDFPGGHQHIGYPSTGQLLDGTIVCMYHEWHHHEPPIRFIASTHFQLP